MEFEEHHITYERTGRFISLGDPEKADTIVIALHGYAQLATEFIEHFEVLDRERYFVVCAEGPHRFYHKGRQGKVVASWMTSEDRTNDIKGYINYLDQVYNSITEMYSFKRKVLLGFSQGGATASRWIELGKHEIDTFILWASVFPPDLEQRFSSPLDTTKNYFVVGNNDEYFDPDRKNRQFRFLQEMGMNFEFVKFDGNHNIHQETLLKLLES